MRFVNSTFERKKIYQSRKINNKIKNKKLVKFFYYYYLVEYETPEEKREKKKEGSGSENTSM